jgi:hypothetical protein
MCVSVNQIGQVVLTLPYSFSQMGYAYGLVFLIFYGLLGAWTVYILTWLYFEFKSRRSLHGKVYPPRHVLQVRKKKNHCKLSLSLSQQHKLKKIRSWSILEAEHPSTGWYLWVSECLQYCVMNCHELFFFYFCMAISVILWICAVSWSDWRLDWKMGSLHDILFRDLVIGTCISHPAYRIC